MSHSGGRPIIFLPDRKSNPQIPTGSVEVTADGETFVMDFVKVAVNVARPKEGGENELRFCAGGSVRMRDGLGRGTMWCSS